MKIQRKNGVMHIDVADLRYKADEFESVQKCLDELGVPKHLNGNDLSLWGRVSCYYSGN